MRRIFWWAIPLLCLAACKKAEDRTCLKTTGSIDLLELKVATFDELFLHKHLVYELIQDSTDKIVVHGGKHLIKQVKASNINGLLDVRNDNKCNFLRSYQKKITVEIHFTSLTTIRYEGSEPLTNQGKLKFDGLNFLIKNGSGSVYLDFDAQHLRATVAEGWGDFTFYGKVQSAHLDIRGNGYCDLLGMNILDSVFAISNSQGDIKLNADGAKLVAQLKADGNIYYKGKPSVIAFEKWAKGALIQWK